METNALNWQDALKRWHEVSSAAGQPTPVPSPGVSERDLLQAEKRLGVRLPPSYKAFLSCADGWEGICFYINRLRPLAEVEWLIRSDPSWIDAFAIEGDTSKFGGLKRIEYFSYSEHASQFYSEPQLAETLQISDVGDAAVVVLNPCVVTEDEEWEAWVIASWLPGVRRYPSFAEMFRDLCESQVSQWREEGIEVSAEDIPWPRVVVPAPSSPRKSAKKVGKGGSRKQKVPLEELVAGMEHEEIKRRLASAAMMRNSLTVRAFSERRPDLEDALTRIAVSAKEPEVRAAALSAISVLCESSKAVRKAVVAGLRDPDGGVRSCAGRAANELPHVAFIDAICDGLTMSVQGSELHSLLSAASEHRQDQILRALDQVLNDPALIEHSVRYVVSTISRFADEGLRVLERGMSSNRESVRIECEQEVNRMRSPPRVPDEVVAAMAALLSDPRLQDLARLLEGPRKEMGTSMDDD